MLPNGSNPNVNHYPKPVMKQCENNERQGTTEDPYFQARPGKETAIGPQPLLCVSQVQGQLGAFHELSCNPHYHCTW